MTMVNVLVIASIGEECLQQVSSISSKVRLTDASELARGERRGDLNAEEKFNILLAEAEVIYGFTLPKNMIARAPRLKWVQTMSAGIDGFLDDEFRKSSVIMTTVSGVDATPLGEFVLELMLMVVKQAPLCFDLKQKRQWKRFTPTVLRSKTIGIVGLGNVGREVARLAKAFGMRVVATRRSAKRATRSRYVDMLLPRDQLPQLLSESDFVVLALPLTSETNGLIGERELRTMKSTAYLINVARGSIVDEEALIRALDEHWIAGAGLDVFATEPLPPSSKLWELPNVIFSPHVAGGIEDYSMQATEIFSENLRRYLNGKKLLNVVNKKKGY
jgi:phosphoglycerate dehydrogenase-like enzyme